MRHLHRIRGEPLRTAGAALFIFFLGKGAAWLLLASVAWVATRW